METRVYVGDRSSGRVYDPIYMGKVKPACVYASLYMIVTKLSRVQVREQILKGFNSKNGFSFAGWLLNGGKGSMKR
jgi:hypothetical protein